MAGRIINGIKYIVLHEPNDLKKKSLEHNIYFTLRDIFWNGEENDCIRTNYYNNILRVNNCTYKEEGFGFSNALRENPDNFTKNLYNYLKNFDKKQIYFTNEGEEGDYETNVDYILFDDWWKQLQSLIDDLHEFIIKFLTF